jgi:crossover junction endodeoxyribonuclease RuvC
MQVGLRFYLLIERIEQPYSQQGCNNVFEYYFDIFVCSYHEALTKGFSLNLQSVVSKHKNKLQLHKNSKIILGIDPGTLLMGFGIIKVSAGGISLVFMDVLKLSPKKDAYERLRMIHQKVCALVAEHGAHECAIEAPFFGKNVQSMLKLGRAQGVAIAAVMQAGVPVTEYSPRKVKQSITGNGNADKLQVLKMLQRIVIFEESPKYFDATDALAVAVCHYFQGNTPPRGASEKLSGWKDFMVKNPQRVK